MAAELDLKALREKVAVIGYSADPTYEPNFVEMAIFILKQIERVEGCQCGGYGEYQSYTEGPIGHGLIPITSSCSLCADLRADLMELQKQVLG